MAAGNSVIGALRVELGLDSANFTSGLKSASGALNKFGIQLTLGVETIVEKVGQALGAIPNAIGDAIEKFDELSKSAQKVGVTTESLSQLSYAAGLSDVSLDDLTSSLQRLSKGMADVATGSKGPAASAFAALGISVTDAAGKLRASDEVFADIADKFARMETGSTKTALAIQLFGKSGAQLIPLLNSGRDGLKEMADESDRLGNTISTQAGANAEAFGDNLTRLQTALTGVTNIVTSAALPVLTYLSQKLVEVAGNGKLTQAFADGFIIVLKSVVTVGAVVVTTLTSIASSLSALLNAMRLVQTSGIDAAIGALTAGGAQIREDVGATIEFINGLWAAVDAGTTDGETTPLTPFVADMDALKTSTDAATLATKVFQQAQQEGMEVYQNTRTPLEKMQMDLDRLGQLLNQGTINWETYGRAVNAATMGAAAATLDSVGQVTGALAGAFKDNKAFAAANIVVSTAAGIMKALEVQGPLGWAQAAAIGVAGAAQLAAVMSAQPGGGSVKGASAAAPSAAAPMMADPGRAINLTLLGGGRYSRNELEGLFRDMNDAMGDGMKLNVSNA